MVRRCRSGRVSLIVGLAASLLAGAVRGGDFTAFESGPVRPLALAPDGERLFAVNTPDNRLEILRITAEGLVPESTVPVGLEPVAVAAGPNGQVWVVNHLSDSISIVDTSRRPPRVVRTLQVGDEPRDIVFAGPGGTRAFLTTAHRGQNHRLDAQLTTRGVGRADVWVFDAGQAETPLLGIVTLFGDTPRALAASPDGGTVYAAVFQSGNQTATVSQEAVCDGGITAPPCEVEGALMPGGLPPPNANFEGVPQPETGLIVRYNESGATWEDELGRDWKAAMRFSLPDKDVFALDAMADPPRESLAVPHVGTILFNLAVNPVSGTVYVSNTEARNEVRFAGSPATEHSTVRGRIHEARLSLIRPDGTVAVRRLNKHLDGVELPASESGIAASLSMPMAMAVSRDGRTLYVAGFGSAAVAVFDTAALAADSFRPEAVPHIELPGGGPSGLILDENRRRLYVATRFDNAVVAVDLDDPTQRQRVPFFNPEPLPLIAGRPLFYDARRTSGNGESSCASCHLFGHTDGLAWDLGDPDGPVLRNPNVIQPGGDPRVSPDIHPMKGPMTTQTLRGLLNHGPMHWRGDRSGGFVPGGDPYDERAALLQFNEAFDGLLARGGPIPPQEMQSLANFLLSLVPPPQPIRALDNSLNPLQQAHFDEFTGNGGCLKCHALAPEAGVFGTSGRVAVNPNPGTRQYMKIPTLRGLYEKVGLFASPPGVPFGDRFFIGDQVRGFGIQNDGAPGRLPPPTEQFLLAFPSNLAPIVGQQADLGPAADGAALAKWNLLRSQAALGECDLTAKGVVGDRGRGWYRTANGDFQPDRAAEAPVAADALVELAASAGGLLATCVPPGSGIRIGVDRDADGAFDGDELDAGSDPADPVSLPGSPSPSPTATRTDSPTPTETALPSATPSPSPTRPVCDGDCDASGEVTIDELLTGVNIALGTLGPEACGPLDRNRDDAVTVDELLVAVNRALQGCSTPESPGDAPSVASLHGGR